MARMAIPEPADGAAPSEPDEVQVLDDLYGPPDPDGVYRGWTVD